MCFHFVPTSSSTARRGRNCPTVPQLPPCLSDRKSSCTTTGQLQTHPQHLRSGFRESLRQPVQPSCSPPVPRSFRLPTAFGRQDSSHPPCRSSRPLSPSP